MLVKSVPTLGWTRGDIEATIRLVTQEQRQALAVRVRAEMERQNLDNVRLSRSSGVSEKTISRIINAKLAPRYSTIERLEKGLGLEPNALWGSLGAPPATEDAPGVPDLSSAFQVGRDQLDRIEEKLDRLLAALGVGEDLGDANVSRSGLQPPGVPGQRSQSARATSPGSRRRRQNS